MSLLFKKRALRSPLCRNLLEPTHPELLLGLSPNNDSDYSDQTYYSPIPSTVSLGAKLKIPLVRLFFTRVFLPPRISSDPGLCTPETLVVCKNLVVDVH